jgi:hypothetical protein
MPGSNYGDLLSGDSLDEDGSSPEVEASLVLSVDSWILRTRSASSPSQKISSSKGILRNFIKRLYAAKTISVKGFGKIPLTFVLAGTG